MVLRLLQWAPGLIFGGLILSVVVPALLWAWILEGDRTSHLRDWPTYYRTDVSRHFKLPPQAQVVHAEDYSPWPLGQEVRVRFRLPATRTPEEWVKHIANSSGIPDRFRKDPLQYDGPGDMNIVSYDRATGLFEVLYGWD